MAGIRENPSFDYGNALLASTFSNLAYKQREGGFADLVTSTGWTPIGVTASAFGPKGFSRSGIGYGVDDPLNLLTLKFSGTQSYGIAAKRALAGNKTQFLIGFEGSSLELADWAQNAGKYGWSEHYTTLIPLLTEVIQQMLLKPAGSTELIITGHSLGGAIAQIAFGDLLAPRGNLWPDSSEVLTEAKRIYSALNDWSDATKQQILNATSLYTFGAPSFLIEPNKLTGAEVASFVVSLPSSPGLLSLIAFLTRTYTAVTVNNAKIPNLSAVNNTSFGSGAFQFGHQNSSWYYPGDTVAQLGSRQPGNVLDINLDNSIHRSYTNAITQFIPAGTHSMGNYQESVIRLITGNTILKSSNPMSSSSPELPETSSNTGSTTNDRFTNRNASGLEGNDLFIYRQASTYTANGGPGNDIYTIGNYGIAVTIDGANQSGRDTLIFDLQGTRSFSRSGTTALFSVSNNTFTSSVTITNWDQWQVSDVFQVSKPTDGRWSLIPWTNLGPGLDFSISSEPLDTPATPEATPSKPYTKLLITAEATGADYANQNLSLDQILTDLRDPNKRTQFSIAIDTTETDESPQQSGRSDSSFYRIARNRYALDTIVATPAGPDFETNILSLVQNLAGEGSKPFQAADARLEIASDKRSLTITTDAATTTTDVVNLRSELISRPSKSSILAYVVLNDSEDPASLSITSLRGRAQHVLSALESAGTADFAASLDQGQTLELIEGRRLSFFEVGGNSIASASSFTLLQPTATTGNTVELRTSLGMVVQLIGQSSGSVAGLTAFIAREQKNAPLFNLSGLKATDTLTGQVVLAREASFQTDAGFYRIEDTSGAVRDSISGNRILPGDQGYTTAALAQSVGRLSNLRIGDMASSVANFSLSGDSLALLAPFAVVQAGSTAQTYFAFARANPDGLSHFRVFGDNLFGLEDQLGGGDMDYDDLVVGFRNLALA
jgi:hypothetical protein